MLRDRRGRSALIADRAVGIGSKVVGQSRGLSVSRSTGQLVCRRIGLSVGLVLGIVLFAIGVGVGEEAGMKMVPSYVCIGGSEMVR